MRTKFTVCLSILLILAGLAVIPGMGSKAEAAGFALYEWGARGNALGGSLIARADDPSALAWNPAGITQLEGTQMQMGVAVITPKTDITTSFGGTSTKTSMVNNAYFPANVYMTHQINENLWFGLAGFTRFGLGTEYNEDWAGRYSSYNTSIESYSLNPNLAYKFNKYISIAGGLELMKVRADLRKKLDSTGVKDPTTTSTDVDQRIIVNGMTPGFNVGVRITPTEKWSVGLSYRSKMNHKASGSASYNVPASVTSALFNDSEISMAMKTPNMVFFGVAYEPLDNLSLEVDAIWSQWSDYSELTYYFDKATAIGTKDVTVMKKWQDVWRFQVGLEYLPIEDLALRVGYVYDQSPIRKGYEDYMLPTNDRQIISTGLGWTYDSFTVDVSYMYLWMKDRTIKARTDGVLDTKIDNSRTHIVGVSMGFKF
ncbi:OmpP1/FadL family transporter [Maridesulfovibrio hydrothermalis]|uniref:Membrane protein involved in aromatic hydrocarbon degradation n=1 Tax=Maridesulfovibrio hydrothermalis AM13 = DSM 14728 TaxID=1121451 RepID=L0RE78_9BACT|nr:OmpP1/FadL family transporter [Maridesulfovibrio hydrothermalis]CCO24485.1 Membrane protein involved in aromatic hydrocarbon degradation [Maridesulfovibrio hydrothermalis AM13 = DSM 14728]